MSRYTIQFPSYFNQSQIQKTVEAFYDRNGFRPYYYKNEQWYKKGSGLIMGPQVMRVTVIGQTVTIEGFIRPAILPGVYVGETNLDNGFIGSIPSSALKEKINTLIYLLSPAAQPVKIVSVDQVPVPLPIQIPQNSQQQHIRQPQNMQQNQAYTQNNILCKRCGYSNTFNSTYCAKCGEKLY